ncbi:MAG: ATP-binding protein [Emcibacter sp.]|nr:ATP-binding protein [Emcibacter sp.]
MNALVVSHQEGPIPTIHTITRQAFRIRTFEQAADLSHMLSLACREPDRIAFGLFELLANAIEHGNLDMTSGEKLRLMEQDAYQTEIERRLALPKYKDRYVEVLCEEKDGYLSFLIEDQGRGFDFNLYLNMDLSTNQTCRGRGIALAYATSFDRMTYLGMGNKVQVMTKFSDT